MKTIFSNILAVTLTGLALTSCSEEWNPVVTDDGELDFKSMNITNDEAEKLVTNEQSRADGINTDNYIVEVSAAGSSETVNSWTYADMPEIITLKEGDYSVNVRSHDVQRAEWDNPYFCGSKTFSVKAGKITHVDEIVCKFASIKVSVTFSDELKAMLADDVEVTVIANDLGKLVFTKNETRKGYFEALEGSNTMAVTLEGTIDGVKTNVTKALTDIEAGQHRMITFTAKGTPQPPQQTGGIDGSGIDISMTVTDEDIDGNIGGVTEDVITDQKRPWGDEDPVTPPGPGPDQPEQPAEAATFTSETLNLKGFNNPADFEGKQSIVNISCPKGVAHLQVTIKSDALEPALPEVGLKSSFDLAYPGELADALNGEFGFPVGSDVIGKDNVEFDITTFVPLMAGFDGDHIFTIEVEDLSGEKSTLTLSFNKNA